MGGITLMQIIDRMAALIVADVPTATWCATTYGKPLTVMVGLDERNRPGGETCPLVLLRPQSSNSGGETLTYAVLLDWAVYDDAIVESGGISEFAGVRRVDELGQLLWQALRGLPTVLTLNQTEYVIEAVERFPLCLGGMDITINVPAMLSGHITL